MLAVHTNSSSRFHTHTWSKRQSVKIQSSTQTYKTQLARICATQEGHNFRTQKEAQLSRKHFTQLHSPTIPRMQWPTLRVVLLHREGQLHHVELSEHRPPA